MFVKRIRPQPPEEEGWAIPEAIVNCESKFQNDAPWPGHGASGYYQIEPETWSSHGGQEFASEAYEASRYQQTIVARRIRESGGLSEWQCAGIVGY